jgi:recombinational DNA repair protein RecT
MNAANVFLDNLQTLNQGGIVFEDYDKTDFVKRGKTITISARVEAFLRAAARKGYRITETIIAVPLEDADTTYFKENFYNGEIVYTLEDKRIQPDRKVTAERLIKGYFSKFICRLEVAEIKSGKRVVMTNCEMSNDEVLNVSSASEQGLYKAKWEEYTYNGKTKKKKVITDEMNSGTFWVLWTGEMVNKTIIRRALKRIREVLPELKETIYAFDNDNTEVKPKEEIDFEIPMEVVNVDLDNLTDEQQADVDEILELFKANPKLASDKTEEIKELIESGESLQNVINVHYASLINIAKSKTLYPIIKKYFEV